MISSKFSGWKDVFSFTLHQTTKGKAFKITTLCFALFLFLTVFAVNVLTSISGEKTEISPIKTVHVLDESGLLPTDFSSIIQTEQYSGTNFAYEATGKTEEDLIKEIESRNGAEVVLHITKDGTGFALKLAIPSHSKISKSDGEAIINQTLTCFENSKFIQAGLTDVQMASINMPVTSTFTDAGEKEESIGEMLIKLLVPMVFALILYIMLLLYGQTVCKALIIEKSSKLMETLLISTAPYALIIGKILAMTFLAVIQFVLWAGSAAVGFAAGDALARSMNPDYRNPVLSILALIRDNASVSAFSIPAVLLAILVIGIGFLFYCVLAGMIGAVLNKAEDLSSGMGIFQLPAIGSFLLSYIAPIQDNSAFSTFVRYFPFTAPFSVPADLVIGKIGIPQGLLSLIILLLTVILFTILTGRLYKGMVLYNGNKLNLKMVFRLLKAK